MTIVDKLHSVTADIIRPDGTILGSCKFSRVHEDPFGNVRTRPQIVAAVLGVDTVPSSSLRLSPLNPVLDFIAGSSDVYFSVERASGADIALAELVARMLGRDIDAHWPLFCDAPNSSKRGQFRGIMPGGTLAPSMPPGYGEALSATDLTELQERTIADLQTVIEDCAKSLVHALDFDRRYLVRQIMTVGSTSRGTVAALPADFDLVIHTETSQRGIDRTVLRAIGEQLRDCVVAQSAFDRYCEMISAARPSQLVLASIGARGKEESYVARYELLSPAGPAATHICLDITFGRLPQLIGYENWFRRYIDRLSSDLRKRLQREIRLGKRLLRAAGLYGSSAKGFRGHLAEQWIIQSYNYRDSGLPIGTLDNALRLIGEEAGAIMDGRPLLACDFDDYRQRFPIWRPGWWNTEAGDGPAQSTVNLFMLLGNGDPASAASVWARCVALATAHARAVEEKTWTLPSVIARMQALLPASPG